MGYILSYLCVFCVCIYLVQPMDVFISFVCLLRASCRCTCPLALTVFLEIKFMEKETEIVFKIRMKAEPS